MVYSKLCSLNISLRHLLFGLVLQDLVNEVNRKYEERRGKVPDPQ